MYIESCYIRGFGCFTDSEFVFNKGLNVFVWRNGDGKTTFSDFIAAMLYGIPTSRKNSAFSDRERYRPFGGGAFGGSLTIAGEKDGREVKYRIERTFDAKSATGDTLGFYINGEPSEVQAVGQYILGVSEETFRKIFFLKLENMIPGGTEEISSRIANFMGAGEEQVAAALKRLDDAKKELIPKKGRGGVIPEIRQALDSLRAERKRLAAQKDSLRGLYEELRRCRDGLAGAEAAKNRCREILNKLDKWQAVESIEESVRQSRKKLDELYASFGGNLPDDKEISEYKEYIRIYTGLAAESKSLAEASGDGDLSLIRELLPPEERCGIDMETPGRMLAGYEGLRNACAELKIRKEMLEREAGRHFPGVARERLPELAAKAGKSFEKARGARALYEELSGNDHSPSSGPSAGSVLPSVMIAAGTAVSAASAIMYSLGLFAPWVFAVVLAAGVISTAAGVILFAAHRSAQKKTRKKLAEAKAAFVSAAAELSKDLLELGLEGDPFLSYAEMRNDLAGLNNISSELDQTAFEYGRICGEIEEQENALSEYFRNRGVFENDFRVSFHELEKRDRAIRGHDMSLPDRLDKKAALEKELGETKSKLRAFMDRYNIDPDVITDPGRLNDSAVSLIVAGTVEAETKEKLAGAVMTLKGLKEGIGTDVKPVLDFTEEDIDGLDASISAFNAQIAALNTEIGSIETGAASLDRLDSDIRGLEEKLNKKEALYAELSVAYDKLDEAQKNLIDRYFGPVNERFMDLSAEIRKAAGIDMTLTRDLNIYFYRDGFRYGSGYLSTGETAAISLCLKLAVTDYLTGGRASFLVLDDPFTALDRENLELSGRVIERICGLRQIVYFTCHESRRL